MTSGDFAPYLPPQFFPMVAQATPEGTPVDPVADGNARTRQADIRARRRAAARALADNRSVLIAQDGRLQRIGSTMVPQLDGNTGELPPPTIYTPQLSLEDACVLTGATASLLMGSEGVHITVGELSPRSIMSQDDAKSVKSATKAKSVISGPEEPAPVPSVVSSFPIAAGVAMQAADNALHPAGMQSSVLTSKLLDASLSSTLHVGRVYEAAFNASIKREHVARVRQVHDTVEALQHSTHALTTTGYNLPYEHEALLPRVKARAAQANAILSSAAAAQAQEEAQLRETIARYTDTKHGETA
jgi:hypothetical protein